MGNEKKLFGTVKIYLLRGGDQLSQHKNRLPSIIVFNLHKQNTYNLYASQISSKYSEKFGQKPLVEKNRFHQFWLPAHRL